MSLSKPVPTLAQMPWNVKQDIVNSANKATKFSVRGCSKEFKTLVDSSRFQFESLILHINSEEDSISVKLILDRIVNADHINTRKIKFSAHPDGFSKQICHEDGNFEEKVVTGSQNYIDAAVVRFCKTAGNPKLSFVILEITHDRSNDQYQSQKLTILDKIQEFLGSLNHKLSVQTFAFSLFDCQEDILKVLPYFQPGTLKSLSLYDEKTDLERRTAEDLDLVCELEQWKQASKVILVSDFFNLPPEKWAHFSECTINMRFTAEYAKQLIEGYFKNPRTRRSEIWFLRTRKSKRTEIRNYLSQFKVVRPMTMFKVPLANSTDFIGVHVFTTGAVFQRCSETDEDSDVSEESDNSDDSDNADEEESSDSDAEPDSESDAEPQFE